MPIFSIPKCTGSRWIAVGPTCSLRWSKSILGSAPMCERTWFIYFCNRKVLDFALVARADPEWIAQGINKLIHTKNITVRVVLLENKWIFLVRGINSTALVTEFINLWILVREVKLSPLAKDPIMA